MAAAQGPRGVPVNGRREKEANVTSLSLSLSPSLHLSLTHSISLTLSLTVFSKYSLLYYPIVYTSGDKAHTNIIWQKSQRVHTHNQISIYEYTPIVSNNNMPNPPSHNYTHVQSTRHTHIYTHQCRNSVCPTPPLLKMLRWLFCESSINMYLFKKQTMTHWSAYTVLYILSLDCTCIHHY